MATPTRNRPQYTRSNSSPSLAAVGLPPPIPTSELMAPSTPTRSRASLKRAREATTPARKGEVESSTSSPDSDNETLRTQQRRVRGEIVSATTTTPKRKIVNSIDAGTPRTGKKRETLQSRLAAASGPKTPRLSTPLGPSAKGVTATPGSSRDDEKSSDKVVVCVRIKPTESTFSTSAYELSSTSLTLTESHPNVIRRGGKSGREAEYSYTFDTLLQFPSKTPDLYQSKVAPLVEKAMNGFNSTVFAYGQTGSGKSHTMSGTPAELGIIPCAVDGIFDAITSDSDRAFLLRVSYIEIYNETLRDLLNFKSGPLLDNEKPSIHTGKGKVYVEPLVEEIVSTPQDVVNLLDRGNMNRKTGATDWNERSSRSHAVFTIVIESRMRDNDSDDEIRVSKLSLIDLAGSEKAVSDLERRGEGRHINQSLLALREVVHKLTEKGKRGHIPYRNSKLTHLLENVLGGDSNICVICTMSAEEQHCSETLETLKFAGRCSQVETKAQKNILLSSESAMIRAKDLEIAELKQQLEGMGAGSRQESSEQMADLVDSVAVMEARKTKLVEQLAKLNGEILTSELPRSGMGLAMSPPRKKRPRISDFSSFGAAFGLGLGTPKAAPDRRAVSNMVRVSEDSEMEGSIFETLDPNKRFDDDVIASLRRTLSTKDAELASQAGKLTQLEALHEELTKAKAALEATAEEKTKCIAAITKERDERVAELRNTRESHATEISKIKAAIRSLRAQADEHAQRAKSVEEERDAHAASLVTVQGERDSARSDHEAVKREAEKAVKDLESFQQAAKGQENEVIAGLRVELTKEREAREKAESELAAMRQKLEASEAEVKRLDSSLQETSDKLSAAEASKNAAEAKAAEEVSAKDAAVKMAEETAAEREKELSSRTEELIAERDALLATQEASKTALDKLAGDLKDKTEAHDKLVTAQEASKVEHATVSKALDAKTMAHDALVKSQEEAKVAHDNIVGELQEKTKAHDTLVKAQEVSAAEQAKIAGELDNKTKAHDTLTASHEIVKAELAKITSDHADQVKAHDSLVTSYEATNGELAKVTAELAETGKARETLASAHEAIKADLAKLSTEHADKVKVHDTLVVASDAMKSELSTIATQLADKTQAHADSTKEIEELRAGADVAVSIRTELDSHRTLLETEKTERAALAEAHKTAMSKNAALSAELETAKSTSGDLDTAHKATLGELEAAKKSLEQLQKDLEQEKERVREHLAQGEDAMKALETATASHKSLLETAQAEAAALKQSVAEAEARNESLLKSSSSESAEVQNQLSAALSERDELKKKLEQQAASLKTEQDAKAALAKILDAKEGDASKTLTELSRQADAISALEAKLATLEPENAGHKAKLASLEPELTRKKAELAALAPEHASLQAKNAGLEADIAALQAEIARLTGEHVQLKNRHEDAAARGDRLAAELVKKAAPQTPERQIAQGHTSCSSVPNAISATAHDALRGNGGMASQAPDVVGWRKTREAGEIDRLDKVVSAQNNLISEQQAKIKFWAEELEKQREIVRLLTQEGGSPEHAHTPVGGRSPGHSRNAMSMSSVPSPGTPVGNLRSWNQAAGLLNNGSPAPPRKHIPSTFTARNLALPTAPTPLPMHTGQEKVLRKSRRITIEHDMNRLAEGSKVNRIRGVFDSPTKEDAPPAVKDSSRRAGSARTDVDMPRRRF